LSLNDPSASNGIKLYLSRKKTVPELVLLLRGLRRKTRELRLLLPFHAAPAEG